MACIHQYFQLLQCRDIDKVANALNVCRASLFGDLANIAKNSALLERICFS